MRRNNSMKQKELQVSAGSPKSPGKHIPSLQRMLSWIFSHWTLLGNQEQDSACTTGTTEHHHTFRSCLPWEQRNNASAASGIESSQHEDRTPTHCLHQTIPPQTAGRHEHCTRTEHANGVQPRSTCRTGTVSTLVGAIAKKRFVTVWVPGTGGQDMETRVRARTHGTTDT